jgi:DNA-binding LacI/PurR family transcriptional regulator
VLRGLDEYCRGLQPGDVLPSQQELMRQFEASERSVRWALEELRRRGVVVGRQGARNCVADARPAAEEPALVPSEARSIVAIAIPDHALFDQAMNLLVDKAKVEDISVFCQLLPGSGVLIQDLPAMAQKPLGYIVFRRDLIPLAEQLQAQGHRVVAIGTPYVDASPPVPVVYGDHEEGGYLATQHLIELGHRRIAFCAFGDIPQTLRFQGHQRAIREARKNGLQVFGSELHLDEIRSWRQNPSQAEALFNNPLAPTALAVWNDHEAVMVMGQLARVGLHVPEDISIVGYDNLPEGELQHPSLTTVHSPLDQQLKTALNLLTRPTAPTGPYQMLIQPQLVVRESAAPHRSPG